MKRGKKAALTSIAVVAVVGVVGAFGLNGSDGDEDDLAGAAGYCALMSDAIGLYVGNPVTQMGYEIGRVSDIEARDENVKVTFDLAGGRHIPADVQAVTRSKSLLADRSLELVGNHAEGPTLQPGDCIPQDRSFTPKNISEIAGSAADFVDELTIDGSQSVQGTISGLQEALDGIEGPANSMMRHAAEAARNPDQVTADIGSAIMDMAPLTDAALADWGRIKSILDQMPSIAEWGADLFPEVAAFDRGVGWLVAVLYDVQRNYGDDIWPVVHGPVADLIRLAATRAPDLKSLYSTVPSVAAALRQQQQTQGGLAMPYQAPTVKVNAGGIDVSKNLLNLLIEKAGR